MTIEELKKLIDTGEKIDIEFKKSHDNLNKDLYETVCSFNNRDGGHIFLGIVDETKEICGVNSDKIDKMKKDFTTAINNSNKINPLYTFLYILHKKAFIFAICAMVCKVSNNDKHS